jgi:RNA polymerase sigma-70 factor (ECF subfamily)
MAQMTHTLTGALEKVFREYAQELFACALAVTLRPEVAEDAVQEAFYHLFRMQAWPRHLKAYVFRSVRNAAVDQSMRARRDRPIEDYEAILECRQGPEGTALRNEFGLKAAEAMKTLSEDERETVINHVYADLSFREIAKIRQISINTVWSWYRRGMEKLRRQLGNEP